jgi:sugar lactone lactonase YvrE
MKKSIMLSATIAAIMSITSYSVTANTDSTSNTTPETITIKNIAQNPEGIEYKKADNTFLLSSLNATPIIKVKMDGTYTPFTSGEAFPLSTAGLQIDDKRNRLLVAAFNATELEPLDKDPATKGTSHLRIYNLKTGILEKDINLSSTAPDGKAYFANDLTVDNDGNVYISDWYSGIIYKVDLEGKASLFWSNKTGIPSGPNGLDFHPDGYLLVSILNVNEKGLYADYGLVKIPVKDPKTAKVVNIASGFTGFDGMVITDKGNVIGVTNNGKVPGGNRLIELAGKKDWESAEVINAKAINASTTVAITPNNKNFVINQDFSNGTAKNWTIEQIKF